MAGVFAVSYTLVYPYLVRTIAYNELYKSLISYTVVRIMPLTEFNSLPLFVVLTYLKGLTRATA